MSTAVLATKLYVPPPRPNIVLRSRLIDHLNAGLHRKLTLISAAAGFGKTTLLSEWVADCTRPTAWLSLDEQDGDPNRFLTYLISALQSIAPTMGQGLLGTLRSPQPPPIESILTSLLNEITALPTNFILVLDDYHVVDAQSIDQALTFLLDHLPTQIHLVIASREDPHLPLARLRMRGQLTELRATDLRFTLAEAAGFLNQVMGLSLSEEDIAALETRTEGWIAGLQLAAISMQGHQDASGFIKSFTGSHHFVLDYLIEEVLHQQSDSIQSFLLRSSILDRLCGPLCDAILRDSSVSGQDTLKYLEQTNLFIIPLDNERRWYRYHRLFADLLRQRLLQSSTESEIAEYHTQASMWYEENGLELEAFHHAAAARDIDRAERLMEGGGMPLQFRGAVAPVVNWLASLPTAVLDTRPSLWMTYASVVLATGQTRGIEEKLQSAENALQGIELNPKTRDLIGRIAATRATLAVSQHQIETIISQSHRALEYLHPQNLPYRTSTIWKLGYAYQFLGDRVAANRAYLEAIAVSHASGNVMFNTLANTGLGNIQESDNQLILAAETYRNVVQTVGEMSMPAAACEAHLGLARIFYEWNDLDSSQKHSQISLHIARQLQNTDRSVVCEVFLARLKLAQDDVTGAAIILAQASQLARQHQYVYQIPEVAAVQVLTLLRQGHLTAAAHLADEHTLPMMQARVALATGDSSTALSLLEPLRQHLDANNWADKRLSLIILEALAHYAYGSKDTALRLIREALTTAEPNGFTRLFIDEGPLMAQLLAEAARGLTSPYIEKLLSIFEAENQKSADPAYPSTDSLIEPLSARELEVLHLVAQGLSNREISEQLFLALDTIKGHNRRIYEKLQVQRRTEAVARARELGLL